MFTENMTQFFSDFAVSATFGSETGSVLFDAPETFIGDGSVISAEYKITYKTGQFSGLDYASAITVNGDSYTVNSVNTIEDGALTVALLSKV